MLQHGKHLLKEKEERNKRYVVVHPSDYLTDEEDGYTQEVRDRIDEELMNLSKENSLTLKDVFGLDSNPRTRILLVVQSFGSGKFRLGINVQDSVTLFERRGTNVSMALDGKSSSIALETTCGLSENCEKKGLDLYSKEINDWILSNNFQDYKTGHPTKLLFEFNQKEDERILRFLKKIA